jgi:hypothetical protein
VCACLYHENAELLFKDAKWCVTSAKRAKSSKSPKSNIPVTISSIFHFDFSTLGLLALAFFPNGFGPDYVISEFLLQEIGKGGSGRVT